MRAGQWAWVVASCWIALAGGCGVRILDGWAGQPVLRRSIEAPPDLVWAVLNGSAADIGLVVAKVYPDDRVIEFDWVTAPGDGRLYLRCRDAGPVGSASLKPRISVQPRGNGSAVFVGTQVRATTNSVCESTGQFERWLLGRFEPAIVAAAEAGEGARAPTTGNR